MQPEQKEELDKGMVAVNVLMIHPSFVSDSFVTAEGLSLSIICKHTTTIGFSSGSHVMHISSQ